MSLIPPNGSRLGLGCCLCFCLSMLLFNLAVSIVQLTLDEWQFLGWTLEQRKQRVSRKFIVTSYWEDWNLYDLSKSCFKLFYGNVKSSRLPKYSSLIRKTRSLFPFTFFFSFFFYFIKLSFAYPLKSVGMMQVGIEYVGLTNKVLVLSLISEFMCMKKIYIIRRASC